MTRTCIRLGQPRLGEKRAWREEVGTKGDVGSPFSTLPLFVPMSLLASEAGEHAGLAHACGCLYLLGGFFDRA